MPHALLVALALAAAPADSQVIALGVGTQKIISVGDIKWLAVADEKLVDVKPIGANQVLVVGQALGRTRLLIQRNNGQRLAYEVQVRNYDGCYISELRKLLEGVDGIQIRMVGDRLYLDGVVKSGDDASRVRQITALYPNVKSFVKADPAAVEKAARDVNTALAKQGLSKVKATVAGGQLFLEGEVEDRADALKAEALLKPLRDLLAVAD